MQCVTEPSSDGLMMVYLARLSPTGGSEAAACRLYQVKLAVHETFY